MLCEIFGIICYFFVTFWRGFGHRFAKLLDIRSKLRYNENIKLCARAERRSHEDKLEQNKCRYQRGGVEY